MPNITVEGRGTYAAVAGARLVNAIEAAGIDILHRCGGYARCTTCRVTFGAGAPEKMTEAEKNKLAEANLDAGTRLSCQISCDHDMTLAVGMTVTSSGLPDPGGAPDANITPEPVWVDA
jgi:ferredoxin